MPDPTPVTPGVTPLVPPATAFRPLGYTDPRRGRRPGLLTSVGVVSIAVASLGGLLGAALTVQGFGLYMISMAFSRATAAASAAAAGAAATTAPSTSPAATPAAPLPPAAPPAPGTTQPEPEVESTGRQDANANNSLAASPPPATGPTTAATTLPGGALTPAEIQSVVGQAQTVSAANGGTPLNPAQVASLRTLLTSPTQPLVPPGSAQGAITVCHVDAKGAATFQFAGGTVLVLGPAGNVVSPMSIPVLPNISINPFAIPLFMASAVLSVGLAIFLLVAGIFVLRDSIQGRRLHLIYAGIKIPLALALGSTITFVGHELIQALRASAPSPAMFPMRVAYIVGGVAAGVGCVYPVVLLIVLNTRRVREYYHSVHA